MRKSKLICKFASVAMATMIIIGAGSYNVAYANENLSEIISVEGEEIKVTLPDGYDATNTGKAYPTIYLFPKDGLASFDEQIVADITNVMKTLDALDVIVVQMNFESSDDIFAKTESIVSAVDAKYNTIKSADYRSAVGTEIGGYMAYVTSLSSAEGAVQTNPNLFKSVASINGNFTGSDNIWKDNGDILAIIEQIGDDNMDNFYTYLDGATEDENTSMEGSTNDIGAKFIEYSRYAPYAAYPNYLMYGGTPYTVHEFTSRNGDYDAEFLDESIDRVANRLSTVYTNEMVSGTLSVTPQAAREDVPSIEATYSVTLDDTIFDSFETTDADIKVNIRAIDPATGAVLASNTSTEMSGTLSLDNKVNGTSSTITLSVEVLGMEYQVASTPLVRIQETGETADTKLIDLMGDWNFSAYKEWANKDAVAMDTIEGFNASDWSTWDTVVPGLAWWTADFHEDLGNNANWSGYAWYAREFEVPAGYQTEGELLLALGKFDEADEVYINGVRVGATGIAEAGGAYDGSNPWDKDRLYTFDASILNEGTNEIAIRMCNSSGGGGWYSGPVGIFTQAAYNKQVGLPSVYAPETETNEILEVVSEQNADIETKDFASYAKTIAPEFWNDGYDKGRTIDKMEDLVDGALTVSVVDENANVFLVGSEYLYQATRKITVDGVTSEIAVSDIYKVIDGEWQLYGNQSRFFMDTYTSSYAASASGSEEETRDMTYRVYLPEGYFESDERYPVVYMFHQLNSTSKSYEIDGLHELFDEGMESGSIEDMIVVFPDSSNNSFWRDDWEKMVTDELMPEINDLYRTIPDARFTGTAGCSMGGFGAYNVGLNNPELFSSVISFYGAVTNGTEENGNYIGIVENIESLPADYLSYYDHYFISGNRDMYGFAMPAINIDQDLRSKGVDGMFLVENGAHDNLFYVPHVIEAYSYISDNLYETPSAIVDTVSGGAHLEVVGDGLIVRYGISVEDSIKKYFNVIPDSAFTTDTNPDLVMPVTVEISQNGKEIYKEDTLYNIFGEVDIQENMIISPNEVIEEGTLDVKITASLLGKNTVTAEVTVDITESDLEFLKLTDVKNHWASDDIKSVFNDGLFNGISESEFDPNGTMTRAMVATVIHRMADSPQVELMYGNYSDVVQGSWYEMSVAWASKEGIVTGTGIEMFSPNGSVTREQLVTMLWRYAGEPMLADYEGLSTYSDVAEIDLYAQKAFAWAHQKGIITGKTEDTLDPNGFATRAEVATMLVRFINS